MKTLLKYAAFALLAGILLYGLNALAAGGGSNSGKLFDTIRKIMTTTFKNVRTVVYIFGAFALIVIAVGAIMGKLDFKKVGYFAVGLAIVAGADLIISYAIKGTAEEDSGNIGRTDFDLK